MANSKETSSGRRTKSTRRAESTKTKKATSPKPNAQPTRDWDQVTGTVADRRVVGDRRAMLESGGDSTSTSTGSTGMERRRGPGRRRTDFTRAAEEGEMTQEQFLFLMAIDAFKRANHVTYPTWSDVLEILRRLGYRKVQPSDINLPNAEDWTERSDAPAFASSAGARAADDPDGDGEDESMDLNEAA